MSSQDFWSPDFTVNGIRYPQALDEVCTMSGLVRLWGVPVDEADFAQNVNTSGRFEDLSSIPLGEAEPSDELLAQTLLTEGQRQLLGMLRTVVTLGFASKASCEEEWAYHWVEHYGSVVGAYEFIFEELERNKDAFAGFDGLAAAQAFHGEVSARASQVVKAFLEGQFEMGNHPDEPEMYAVLSNPEMDGLNAFCAWREPLATFGDHYSWTSGLWRLPTRIVEVLNGDDLPVRFYHLRGMDVLDTFVEPDVPDRAAFQEVFVTLVKDGMDVRNAYKSAQLL